MSTGDKAIILTQVENKSRGKRQALMALGIPKSSYYIGGDGAMAWSPTQETEEGRGTVSLRKKKTGYWR